MSRCVIRIITDPTRPESGPMVEFYNPDGHGGRGELRLTADPARALTFPDSAQAIAAYRQTSSTHPRRGDGHPNRPPTALTVLFDVLEED